MWSFLCDISIAVWSLVLKAYVDNFDVNELVKERDLPELLGPSSSLAQQAYRRVLEAFSLLLSAVDSFASWAAPSLKKVLDHISFAMWLLAQSQVCRLCVQATVERWVFDFQHCRSCYAPDGTWSDASAFRGWRQLSTAIQCELLMCCIVVLLVYTDMLTVFCTDASEFGGRAHKSVGLTASGNRYVSWTLRCEPQIVQIFPRDVHSLPHQNVLFYFQMFSVILVHHFAFQALAFHIGIVVALFLQSASMIMLKFFRFHRSFSNFLVTVLVSKMQRLPRTTTRSSLRALFFLLTRRERSSNLVAAAALSLGNLSLCAWMV